MRERESGEAIPAFLFERETMVLRPMICACASYIFGALMRDLAALLQQPVCMRVVLMYLSLS